MYGQKERDLNPRKYLIKDLRNKPTPFDVWIQGTIEQTVDKDILIISDSPKNRAKVKNCKNAIGSSQRNFIRQGIYCCVIGTVLKSNALPEINAVKLIDLNCQQQMKDAWENEVKEASLVLQGIYEPKIK
ncbi:uncharacterized protein LOC116771677 [Danaus plexippus]|uniref:Uncharacterized protein n=1 Tax=Danaus plexippus plexippus TaxID=278856 RepID=A0A212F5B0_DANPL|nr:uncharacterized protein LOC116771677 [Danaus plexippus]OWR48928.1 hypothetical protein KGM_207529 [Danaus plexippus plexippus]